MEVPIDFMGVRIFRVLVEPRAPETHYHRPRKCYQINSTNIYQSSYPAEVRSENFLRFSLPKVS